MYLRTFFFCFAAVGTCFGALTSNQLETALLGAALAYHKVGENVRLAGPDGQRGAAVISSYRAIVSGGGALPPPNDRTFPKAVQFALCGAESTAVLQILETLTQFKLNVANFTPSQISKIRNLLEQDMSQDAVFSPSFAEYVPACADAVNANGNATQASYMAAIDVYSA